MPELNTLLTEHSRLVIMSILAASPAGVSFSDLVEAARLTRGNLSAHIRKLEEAGLVEVTKEFLERKPCTTIRATKRGTTAVQNYLEEVEQMLKAVRKGFNK